MNHISRFITGVLFTLLCQVSFAEPMLNGVGVHKELGREVFIGALFSESLSNDAGTLLRNPQPMRMELKIVAPEGITARRFSRLWIEGLAVNSKPDELMAQADNTVLFDNMFKGRLLKDDYVVITQAPNEGVTVTLNSVELGKIKDDSFFYMLLATWIGSVPLASDYRDSLLKVGDVDAGLRSRFNSIAPTAARTAEVSGWNSSAAPEVAAVTPEPETTPSVAAVTPEALPKLDTPAIDKPKLDIPLPITQPAVEPKPSATVAANTSAAAVPAPAATTNVEEEEDEGPALTTQTLLARQFYVSDSIKKIRTKTRYPQRALDKDQAGSVRVAVTVDRSGNLLSSSIIESSQYELLNKEALAAVKRSEPFAALPDTISGARFEFTVPIRWTLPE